MEINTNMHLNITNVKRSFGMSNTRPASDCFFLYTSVLFSVSCFFYQIWWPQFSWLYIQGSVYSTAISYCRYLGLDSHWESSPNLHYVSSLLINPICPSNKKSIVASVICAVPNS